MVVVTVQDMGGDVVEEMQEEAQEFREAPNMVLFVETKQMVRTREERLCFFHGSKAGMSYRGRLP